MKRPVLIGEAGAWWDLTVVNVAGVLLVFFAIRKLAESAREARRELCRLRSQTPPVYVQRDTARTPARYGAVSVIAVTLIGYGYQWVRAEADDTKSSGVTAPAATPATEGIPLPAAGTLAGAPSREVERCPSAQEFDDVAARADFTVRGAPPVSSSVAAQVVAASNDHPENEVVVTLCAADGDLWYFSRWNRYVDYGSGTPEEHAHPEQIGLVAPMQPSTSGGGHRARLGDVTYTVDRRGVTLQGGLVGEEPRSMANPMVVCAEPDLLGADATTGLAGLAGAAAPPCTKGTPQQWRPWREVGGVGR